MKPLIGILMVGVVMLSSAVLAQDDSAVPDTSPEALVKEDPSTANDNVRRAVFTTNVFDREPVDELNSIPFDAVEICFFSEIVNLTGGSITHRWLHGEETMAEVTFNIGGPRWRVYSRKTVLPDQIGPWTVEVVDGDGNIIQSSMLPRDDRMHEPAASEDQTTQDG